MISYEDLCQSLDRFNARRRNEQEMANLEGATEPTADNVDFSAAQVAEDFAADATGAEDFAAADQLEEPAPEAAVEADLDAYGVTAAETELPADEAEVAAAAGDGFADQPPEDTHEIDVDDVMVEDRLSDDKLPGD